MSASKNKSNNRLVNHFVHNVNNIKNNLESNFGSNVAIAMTDNMDANTSMRVKVGRSKFNKNTRLVKKYVTTCLTSFLTLTIASLPMTASADIKDMHLNMLIMKAIDTHPLVGSAVAEQKATQEGINAAKRNMLPAPSISSGYQAGNDMTMQMSVRQPLWTGGKLTANVNQSIFDDKAAVEFVFEQQNSVAKNTIDAWQTYISAIAMQRVYEESLRQLDGFEAMMKRRVGQGVSARIELELLTNRILQQQNANQGAKEQERIAAARLEQIVGEPLAAGTSYTVPPLKMLTQEAKNLSVNYERMVFDEASFRNATVVKEYYQIESAKQALQADKATNFPTVYAQYAHDYNYDTGEDDGQFSIGMNYEPGAGFANMALTRASESRVDSLVQSQEASRRTIMENIQIQYQKFAGAKDKELSLIAAAAGNQIVVDSYRRQFIAGRKSWLEVLNAVREQSDSKIDLVNTRTEMLGAFHKLQVDLGEMPWQEFQFNRQPQPLFHAIDPVDDWLSQQENVPNSIKDLPQQIKTVPNYLKGIPKSLQELVEKNRNGQDDSLENQ